MTIRINAPRSWYDNVACGVPNAIKTGWPNNTRVRIIRESDWRKIVAVVKAADKEIGSHMIGCPNTSDALDTLCRHLEKHK